MPRKTFNFFLALPIKRSSLEGDGRSHEESLSLILAFEPAQVLWCVFLWLLSECPLPPLLVASAIIHKVSFWLRTWLPSQFRLVIRTIPLIRLTQNPHEIATKTCCQHTRHPPSVQTKDLLKSVLLIKWSFQMSWSLLAYQLFEQRRLSPRYSMWHSHTLWQWQVRLFISTFHSTSLFLFESVIRISQTLIKRLVQEGLEE